MLKRLLRKIKNNLIFLVLIALISALVYVGFVYIFHKPSFELFAKDTISYSGLKATINTENVSIVSIHISGSKDGTNLVDIYKQEEFLDGGNQINIKIKFKTNSPVVKMIRSENIDHFYLHYSISYKNSFFTSFIKDKIKLKIDFDPPKISNIRSDGYIYQGGIGYVLYDTSVDAIKSYVDTGVGKMFYPISILKDEKISNLVFFTCSNLPCKNNKIIVVAEDRSGNKVSLSKKINTLSKKAWPTSDIKINSKFLLMKYNEIKKDNKTSAGLKEFRELNINERAKNDQLLTMKTEKIRNELLFNGKFVQMKNSKVFSTYSEKRNYFIDGIEGSVDSKYHLGIDLASTANAKVNPSNRGIVSYVDNDGLGIYGKSIVIDHGLGFYTLYSHLNTISVGIGEKVDTDSVIGNTGSTGYAFGDHLHFATYIQGVSFNPIELFDSKYINLKIIKIYKEFIKEQPK